jgi:hypothetical protein
MTGTTRSGKGNELAPLPRFAVGNYPAAQPNETTDPRLCSEGLRFRNTIAEFPAGE